MNSYLLATTGIVEGVLSSMQFMVFLALTVSGLIALGVAAVFGGHHDSIEHDADGAAEHATDGQGEHGSAPSFLSPRVFFAFMTGFGVAGAIATIYGANAAFATGIGFIPGMVMATIAWGVAYMLFKQQCSSSIRPGQVVGCIGTVVTTIYPKNLGEINASVGGQIVPYTAMAEDGVSLITAGTRVKVVCDLGDRVTVTTKTSAT